MKPRSPNTVILWSALMVGVTVGFVEPANAEGNAGKPDTEIQIGEVKTFTSEEQAKRACGSDTVVWADRYAGYVYFPREIEYGRTSQGAFACLKSAEDANYWSTGPMSGMAAGHGPGRNFPFTPIPLPPTS